MYWTESVVEEFCEGGSKPVDTRGWGILNKCREL